MLTHDDCRVRSDNSQRSSLFAAHCSLARRARTWATAALSLGLLTLASGCTSIDWHLDQQAGLRKAVDNRQRAVIEFVGTFDDATRKMDSDVFSDPDVVRLMRNFVAIRLDAATHKDLVEKFGVQATPAFVVVRPDLTVSGMQQGYMKADQFRLFLIRNSLN